MTAPTTPSTDPSKNDVKDSADESQARSGSQGKGVHAPKEGEQIVSRSADPGQSSYGGFSNEDTSKQTQEVEADADGTAKAGAASGSDKSGAA